jgi:S1-C subfamily serine protease
METTNKLNLQFIIIFLFLTIIPAYGQTNVVFNEEFENNDRNWDIGRESNENSEIKLGKYLMENFTNNNWNWYTVSFDINTQNDFIIESNLNLLKTNNENDAFGIMWGSENPENCFGFVINTQHQTYKIFSKYNNKWFNLVNWRKSSLINYGNTANKLGVAKIGKELVLVINDEPVDKLPFQEFYGNKIGFCVWPKMEIAADNLIVKELKENSSNFSSSWKGNGTGFVVDSRGYIVTNYHVIDNANDIEIDLIQSGQKNSYKAKVISTDKQNDLAVIKIEDSKFKSYPKLPYNFKTQLSEVGTNVFALGYPMALTTMGEEIKFTDGKISSKTGFQGDITTYQISVPVQPGNSGGPLFDYDGNIIGVVNAKIMAADNVSYAIKSNYVKNIFDVLPESLILPSDVSIATKTLTEKIKILSDYVVLIKVK